MENLRSRVDIKLKSRWDGRFGARMFISKPNFKKHTVFDENLVAIELKRTSIIMNKPITVGLAILDISKIVMYDFHYNFMKPKYGENVTLNYTDTDSFIYQVKSECFYTDMKTDLHEKYDTSDYPADNIYTLPLVNKKVNFNDYYNCVMNNSTIAKSQNSFRSNMHNIYTIRQKKVALSPFDDKRYILPNNIDTLAWGHYKIPV